MKAAGHASTPKVESGVKGEVTLRISPNAVRVLKKRYLAKDENGKVFETPEGMFRRVAHNLVQADALYGATPEAVRATEEEFYAVTAGLDFLPNSPTLMNAGRPLQQLAACFVLPVEDSITGIYDTLKHQALIHQTGGGTGFSFSRLRPKDDVVRSTGGVASGPVSFMKVYNQSTEHIKQGGTRRGANMGILRVDHPDILEFITCKTDTKEITNFNISVAVTDAFMKAALNGEMYDLENPRSGKAVLPVVPQLPGQGHREEAVPESGDREMHQGQPEDRPGCDGIRPHALQSGRPVRLRSRHPDGRTGHEVHLRDRLRRVPAYGREARRVPLLEGLPPRGARPAGAELLRDHRGPDRHDQHDRGYVGRLRTGV